MGKMILNGTKYSGGAEIAFANGLYLDANNIIVPDTTYTTEFYYTATEDCFVRCNIDNAVSNSGNITVDGIHVAGMWSERWNLVEHLIPLKKGQTIHAWQTDTTYSSNYSVYGVQPASNVTFIPDYASACYSSEEREVGCWVDGKPLYQITIDQTIGADADYTVFANGIENAHLVNAKCEYSSGRWMSTNYPSIGSLSSSRFCYVEVWNGALKLHNQTNQSMRWIATIQYTKTTDVAGSGNWTPLGKPTVHYSTEEQVIGTWIDGKPLYQRTWDMPTITVSSVGAWISTSIDASNMASIVDVKIGDNRVVWSGISAVIDGGIIKLINTTSQSNLGVSKITLQYTKTTD